ncbi:hypothetical protein [Leptospira alexanderi]|uniref:hypothetical protein n=1 Tax=Leptospira alexanderi TaxID=100053 RepID=UPI0014802305|nr:hypothetical protein [Leptospira alexanderi]
MNKKALENIMHSFLQYQKSEIDIGGLRKNISAEVLNFEILEDREIYYEVLKLESNIDSIQFTVSKKDQYGAVENCLNTFLKRIS